MNKVTCREEIALEIYQENSFSETYTALNRAVKECREEGKQPLLDPAVGVILSKLANFVENSGFDKAQALGHCRDVQSTRLQKPKLIQLAEKPLGYDQNRKLEFHAEAKKQLIKLATYLGYKKEEYDLRINLGGIAVSGETVLHTDHIYIQVFQGIGHFGDILYRSVVNKKDYKGKKNNYARLKDFNDLKAFARRLNHELDDGRMPMLPDETIGMLF